jgi:hypothetical protein
MKNKLIKLSAIMFLFSTCVIVYAAKKDLYEPGEFYFDYGHKITITSKIAAINNSDNACFLSFHKTNQTSFKNLDDLTLIIFASDLSKFPPNLESHYLNKWVEVTGKVIKYQGKPAIRLTNPFQIQIVAAPVGAKPEPEAVQQSSSDANDLAPVGAKPEPEAVQQSSSSANDLAKRVELLSKTVESQESRIKALEQRVEKLELALKDQ